MYLCIPIANRVGAYSKNRRIQKALNYTVHCSMFIAQAIMPISDSKKLKYQVLAMQISTRNPIISLTI